MSATTSRGTRPIRVLAIGYEKHSSMRLRVQQYEQPLLQDGFDVTTLLLPQSGLRRAQDHAGTVWTAVGKADVVLVQKVLVGWLNLMLRAARKPVVFDLDDAVHYIRPSQVAAAENPRAARDRARAFYRRWVRGSPYYSSQKRLLEQMLSVSSGVILGNAVLREELAPHLRCPVEIIPTSVPRPARMKEHRDRLPVTLGWVGGRGNLNYLETLEPAFRSLAATFGDRIELHVVSSQEYRSAFLSNAFTPWSLEGEGEIVRTFDIGLMPLVDDPFSRGKCAFKAVLCMSFGIPVVISPVGLNADLVRDGWNGYLASEPDEWVKAITTLVENVEMRRRLGQNAFKTIEDGYFTTRAYPALRSMLSRAARLEGAADNHRRAGA